MTESNLHPLTISLHKQSKFLEIVYDDGASFKLPCEYLRVFSPSADVKGHGPGQEVLQIGKETVNISKIEPVGNYAVRLVFDDGHETFHTIYGEETLNSLVPTLMERITIHEAGIIWRGNIKKSF